MTAEGSTADATTARYGFWIVCGTTLFTVGYQILLSVAFPPDQFVVGTAIAFGVLGLFELLGFSFARVISAVLSGLVACFLVIVMFAIIGLSPGQNANSHWPITLVIGIIPAIGYAACAALLFAPSVATWQRAVRERRARWNLAKEAQAQSESIVDPEIVLELCPWCEVFAVDPVEGFCRSCNRPA